MSETRSQMSVVSVHASSSVESIPLARMVSILDAGGSARTSAGRRQVAGMRFSCVVRFWVTMLFHGRTF